jgi:hypothetical protein
MEVERRVGAGEPEPETSPGSAEERVTLSTLPEGDSRLAQTLGPHLDIAFEDTAPDR